MNEFRHRCKDCAYYHRRNRVNMCDEVNAPIDQVLECPEGIPTPPKRKSVSNKSLGEER